MRFPNETPDVQLLKPIKTDIDAYMFIGRVSEALRICGADEEFIQRYIDRALSTEDYVHLLNVSNEYIDLL